MKNLFSCLFLIVLLLSIGSIQNSNAQKVYGYCYYDQGGMIGGIGPVYFNLSDPNTVTLLQDQSNLTDLAGATMVNSIWYGIENNSTNFISIDTLTGERTILSNTGIWGVAGLAIDPTSGNLYILSGSGQLYSIDMMTYQTTYIGGGYGYLFANLAVSPSGSLYSIDLFTLSLYTIDKSNGNISQIGPVFSSDSILHPLNYWNNQDWAFDQVSGVLYWVVTNSNTNNGELWTLDPDTGMATYVNTFPGGAGITSLSIPFTPANPPPTLTEPANNATCIPTLTAFDWSPVDNAVGYSLQIASDASFNNIIVDLSDIITNNYTLSTDNELNPNTQYFWRVRSYDAAGNFSWWSNRGKFNTGGNLNTPLLISPEDNEAGELIPANLSWGAIQGAETYHLQVSALPDFSSLNIDVSGIANTSYSATGVNISTQYYWRVMAENSCPSQSDWSIVRSFTTTNITTVYAYVVNDVNGLIGGQGPCSFNFGSPNDVTLIQNQSGQSSISTGTWALGTWYGTEAYTNNLLTIDPATGNRTLIGYTGISNCCGLAYDYITGIMYALSQNGKLYTVNLTTGEGTMIGGNDGWNQFVSLACNSQGELYGANSPDQSIYRFDPLTGLSTRIAQLTSGTPNHYFYINSYTSNDWDFNLESDKLYWVFFNYNSYAGELWSVDVTNGVCQYLNVFESNAEIDGLAIPNNVVFPTLVSPANNTYCVTVTPTFNWSAVTDAVKYNLQISTASDFSSFVLNKDTLTTTSFTIPASSPLTGLTQYYWRVRSLYADSSTSWWAPKFTFVTDGVIPPVSLTAPFNSAIDVLTPTSFEWQTINGVTQYTVQVSRSSVFSTIDVEQELSGNNIKTFLQPSTQYWWRVKASNPCSTGPWSISWSFTTSANLPDFAYVCSDFQGLLGGEGPCYFYPDNPTEVTLIANQSGQNRFSNGIWINGTWYGIEDGSGNLITCDPGTGARTTIGYTGTNGISGIAYDVTSNKLFAIDNNCALYTIDLSSGGMTYIGTGAWKIYLGLACNTDGNLYGLSMIDQSIYTIDKNTGASTLVAPLISGDPNHSLYFDMKQDWDFDLGNNVLNWAAFNTNYWEGELWTVNPENGVCTYINTFKSNAELDGLAIPYTQPVINQPTLVTPANNSYCIPVLPTLIWNAPDGAVSYSLEVSTTEDFLNLVVQQDNIATTQYTIPALQELSPLTQYWWKVKATDVNGNESWWTVKFNFITDGAIPVVSGISPANGDMNVQNPVRFTWLNIFGTTGYNLQVSMVSDFSSTIVDETITGTSYGKLLTTSTEYYWRIRAFSPCGTGPWTEATLFTTSSEVPSFGYVVNDNNYLIGGQGPCYFYKSNPGIVTLINNQNYQPYFSAGSWKDGVWYNIENGSNNLITCNLTTGERTVIGYTGIPSCTGLTYDFTTNNLYGLSLMGYLYIVDPETGSSNFVGGTENHEFIQLACSPDGTLYAADQSNQNMYSINKTTGEATLIGRLVADDGSNIDFNGAEDWDFDLNNNVLYWAMFNNNSYTGELWTVNPVTAVCTLVNEFYSNARIAGMAIPYISPCVAIPDLITPAENSYCISLNPSMSWYPVPSATSYTFQLSSTADFIDTLLNVDGITDNNYTIPVANQLNTLTQYWWRVQGHNGTECSGWWSAKYKFFTEGTLAVPALLAPADSSTGVMTSLDLQWSAVTGSTFYDLQVSTTTSFENPYIDVNYINANKYIVSGLETMTRYYWRVRSANPCGMSDWSAAKVFVTGDYFVFGNGTNYSETWDYSTPYSNLSSTVRHQYLFRASELTSLGLSAGDFHSIGWDVYNLNGTQAYQNFTIRMKLTTAAEIYNFDLDNLTQVYTIPSYMPVTGWNVHSFDTGFSWDGISNILVDVCFNNGSYNSSSNAQTYYTYMPFSGTTYSLADDNPIMCDPDGPSWSTNEYWRPNTLFGITVPVQSQEFSLPAGWSMISSYIDPSNGDLNNIFSGITGNIIIMKNGNGQNYIPSQDINQIGSWNVPDGYQIKLNNPVQFSITGIPVLPANTNISLIPSWNLIAYLRNSEMPIVTALQNLDTAFVIAKNGLGQMYVPEFGINQIGNMKPGEGYYINVNTPRQLTYPANSLLKVISGEDLTPEPKYLKPMITNTGNNSSLIIRMPSTNEGDEIGVWNTSDKLIGSGVVYNSVAGITIWGDDPTTPEIEGAGDGEILTTKLYKVSSNELNALELGDIMDALTNKPLDKLFYQSNAYVTANGNVGSGIDLSLNLKISPNPSLTTQTKAEFTIPADGYVTIDIYNLQGRSIARIADGQYGMGTHSINIDNTDMSNGVYYLVLRFGVQQVNAMMVLTK